MPNFIVCSSEIGRDSLSGVPGYMLTVASLHFLTSRGCSWVKTAQNDEEETWTLPLPEELPCLFYSLHEL